MTDKKQTLYVWEDNAAAVVWAVQGENKSRKLELTLIEARGGENSQWGAEVVDKPLDLTGMSVPRLYVSKPDSTSVLTDGEIVDAKKGIVSFALTAEQLAVPGTATCQVVLTKPDGEVLKVIGMQLDIQRSNLDRAIESTDDFKSIVIVLDRATKAAELAEAATVTANTAAQRAETAAQNADTKATQAQSAAGECRTATAAAQTATQSATTAADNANTKAGLATTAANTANSKAQLADTAAAGATAIKNELQTALNNGDLQGAPGNVAFGSFNVIPESNRPVESSAYKVAEYAVPGLKPNTTYTAVIQYTANVNQKLALFFNNGSSPASLWPAAVLGNVHVQTVTTPAALTSKAVSIYNYPPSTAASAKIDWICLYEGSYDTPPLYWTPSMEELDNSNVKADSILMADGKTLEDVLREGGLLPATNKGTWAPSIATTGGNTAEFQRPSYAVSGSNVTVQTYLRFTQSTAAQLTNLNISGLPYVCKAQAKGPAITGWALKADPTAIYPRAGTNSSTLSLVGTVGPLVDTPINTAQLADGTAWAHITITYPI